MTTTVGQTSPFVVRCLNAGGGTIPDTNGPITVTTDNPAVGTATCAPDGSAGVFTAVSVGTCNVIATDGTLTSAPFPETVTEDLTPASLVISAS